MPCDGRKTPWCSLYFHRAHSRLFGKFIWGSLMRPNWSKLSSLSQNIWTLHDFLVLCVSLLSMAIRFRIYLWQNPCMPDYEFQKKKTLCRITELLRTSRTPQMFPNCSIKVRLVWDKTPRWWHRCFWFFFFFFFFWRGYGPFNCDLVIHCIEPVLSTSARPCTAWPS